MATKTFKLENYLMHLDDKGFKFNDDAISFIYFGKRLTGSSDYLVSVSIELTLKIQKQFDGSFYLALLETFLEHRVQSKKQAYEIAERIGLFQPNPKLPMYQP